MRGQNTRDRRAALAPPAVALGLLLVLWAATSGPVAVLNPSGRRLEFQPGPDATATASASIDNTEYLKEHVQQTHDLSWIGDFLVWALVIAALMAGYRLAQLAWRHRWHRPARPPEVEFDVLPTTTRVAQSLSEDLDAQVDAVSGGSPRNGIVRCWLRLEESVADAGLPRQKHETSAEFTVRVLHALDLDPRAIGELARLYREARFSEHELGEEARTAARSALERLHQDLARVAGAR